MSNNQNQLYIYAAVALVIGLIVGYVAAGAMSTPTGDEELLTQISILEAEVSSLEGEIEELEAELATAGEETTLSGDLFISGSSTVFPIADLAAEDFGNMYPDVNIAVEGPGSGTGVKKARDRKSVV